MTRKRSQQHQQKKSKKQQNQTLYILVTAILIIGAISALILLQDPGETDNTDDGQTINENTGTSNDGTWLFAMDEDNVQYKYQASGIPTLVIIDKKGDVVFYNSGYHTKDLILPYVNDALNGTAESLGDSVDFTVTTFGNNEFTLSEKKGEVIILDIMGVGCPPCEMQMPELQKIKKEKGDAITILSVDVYFSGETKQEVIDTYGQYIKEE